jgi:hypothetical protein
MGPAHAMDFADAYSQRTECINGLEAYVHRLNAIAGSSLPILIIVGVPVGVTGYGSRAYAGVHL